MSKSRNIENKYRTVCGKCGTGLDAGQQVWWAQNSLERTTVRCRSCGPHTPDVLRRQSGRCTRGQDQCCNACGVTIPANVPMWEYVGEGVYRCETCGPDPATSVPSRRVKTQRERGPRAPSTPRATPAPIADLIAQAPRDETPAKGEDTTLARRVGNVERQAALLIDLAKAQDQRTTKVQCDLVTMIDASEACVMAKVEAMAGRGGSVKLEVHTDRGIAQVEGSHRALKEILDLVQAGIANVYTVGPAGSGKTTLARDLGKALSLPTCEQSLSAGVTEAQLFGAVLPTADGSWGYRPSPLVKAYAEGAVILLDEVDAADPNVLVAANSMIANGHLSTRGGTYARHAATVILCAANTYGTGADAQYVGRNALDAAFLDRFACAQVQVDYDTALEERIARSIVPDPTALLAWVDRCRQAIATSRLRRICSTRTVVNGARLLRSGKAMSDVHAAWTAGWSQDEKAKVSACA